MILFLFVFLFFYNILNDEVKNLEEKINIYLQYKKRIK
jgi:hypothetical protein